MKKNKLGEIALAISVLPFITLVISIIGIEITSSIQTTLAITNICSVLVGFGMSLTLVLKHKQRDVFSILALCISGFFGLLMLGILGLGLLATFG